MSSFQTRPPKERRSGRLSSRRCSARPAFLVEQSSLKMARLWLDHRKDDKTSDSSVIFVFTTAMFATAFMHLLPWVQRSRPWWSASSIVRNQSENPSTSTSHDPKRGERERFTVPVSDAPHNFLGFLNSTLGHCTRRKSRRWSPRHSDRSH